MVAVQQRFLRFKPGNGALTFELFMKHLGSIPNADAVYVDQTLDLTAYLAPCVFKDFKHYREALGFWFHREDDGTVTVKCSMNPADPTCEYEVIARGDGDECFFEKRPEGEPGLAPFWNTDETRAKKLKKDFLSSAKSVGKATSQLPPSFLAAHNHGSSREARQRILSSWTEYVHHRFCDD
jgi:hypothetical protein